MKKIEWMKIVFDVKTANEATSMFETLHTSPVTPFLGDLYSSKNEIGVSRRSFR